MRELYIELLQELKQASQLYLITEHTEIMSNYSGG